jgi:UDP-N-acetylmuramyl pentapeptide synthase
VPDASRAAEALADRTAKRPILLKGSRGVRLEQVFTVLSREEA